MDSLKGILAVLWNVDGPVMLDGSLCQEGDMEVSEVGTTWTGWRGWNGADSELGRPSVVNLGWPPAKSMTCSQLFYGCFNSVSFINGCTNDVENSIGLVCLPNVFLDMSVPTDAPLIAVQKLRSTRCWQCPS